MTGAGTSAGLAPLDVAGRIPRLRARLAGDGLEAIVVTRLPNIRYLTGFTGSSAMLLVTDRDARFVTDGRYGEQARAQVAAAGVDARIEVHPTVDAQREALAEAAAAHARVALEAHGVTWAQQRAFAAALPAAELVPSEPVVEELRREKDAGEIDRIRRACAIADEAFEAVAPMLAGGPTEREVALALEFEMRRRGASGASFDPIVASGPNGARPHARPTDRRIERGELVVCDFGCVVDGYCSDMTRTVAAGDPGEEARRVYEVVRAAQQAGRDAVAAGVECAAVDRACRAVIEDAGYGDAFLHTTGHGVGLEIHESPRVAPTTRGTLLAGDVVTVEPGIYLEGVGGVRIEDTVVVTGWGAEPLTHTPRDLDLLPNP